MSSACELQALPWSSHQLPQRTTRSVSITQHLPNGKLRCGPSMHHCTARPDRGALLGLMPPCRGVSHAIIEELVDSPGSPFHSLGLAKHQQAGGYDRAARRQVNQLRRLKDDPWALALTAAPDWSAHFSDPSLPLVADLGCGAGRCMLAAAAAQQAAAGRVKAAMQAQTRCADDEPGKAVKEGVVKAAAQRDATQARCPGDDRGCGAGGGGEGGGIAALRAEGVGSGCNFLGVDVRLALTSRAEAWAQLDGLQHRAAFLCANANASLPLLLGSYGPSSCCRTSHPTALASASDTSVGGRSHAAAGGRQGLAGRSLNGLGRCRTADDGGAGSGSGGGGGGSGCGAVALVCLQFSDPPVRRRALVGGGDLVGQLAEVLRPGALVWIQSDVLGIARSLRRLFWRHGGFAPSLRHAAATSACVMRHWLPPEALLLSSLPSSQPYPSPLPPDACRATTGTSSSSSSQATAGSLYSHRAALAAAAAELPTLLLGADLAKHREPWLTEEQVAGVEEYHRQRSFPNHILRDERQQRQDEGTREGLSALCGNVTWGCGRRVEPGERDGEGGESPGSSDHQGGGRKEHGTGGQEHESGDGWEGLPWLDANPLGVPTEREIYVERGGRPIYRLLLVRK